jgi:hypothetical protein
VVGVLAVGAWWLVQNRPEWVLLLLAVAILALVALAILLVVVSVALNWRGGPDL